MIVSSSRAFVRRAPAKINLSLRLLGRRPDGYHVLESVVAFARRGEAADRLIFRPSSGASDSPLRVTARGPFASHVPIDARREATSRSAFRLAEAMKSAGRSAPPMELVIDKRLPSRSGLGGGTSDAAVALRALASAWRAPREVERRLFEIGREEGADIPACLVGRAARVSGVGEEVAPLRKFPADVWCVIARPPRGLETSRVFARVDSLSRPAHGVALEGFASREALVAHLDSQGNDLQRAALSLDPVVGDVLDALAFAGCRSPRLSGSGSACFGLLFDESSARRAARRLRSHWWVSVALLG